jgi:hypothetical protein
LKERGVGCKSMRYQFFFAIFLLSDITEIQTRLTSNTNYKDLVKRLISESTPLLQGEGAGGEVINDTTPQGVRPLIIQPWRG